MSIDEQRARIGPLDSACAPSVGLLQNGDAWWRQGIVGSNSPGKLLRPDSCDVKPIVLTSKIDERKPIFHIHHFR